MKLEKRREMMKLSSKLLGSNLKERSVSNLEESRERERGRRREKAQSESKERASHE